MIVAALAFLGRQARWALPAGVFVGIALPGLASLLRPTVTAVVVGTLTSALLRLDWRRFAQAGSSAGLFGALVAWQLVASPLLAWFGLRWAGAGEVTQLVLTLQSAAPPIGSAAAFALILRLDATTCVLVSVAATLLLPVTLTALVAWMLPATGVSVDLLAFFLRVTLVVAMPFAIAAALRRLLGTARLVRHDALLAGINVVMLVVFAIAVMDGVTARLLTDPAMIGGLLAIACAASLVLHAAGYLLFRRFGANAALSAALLSGNRNMGLMFAVTAGTAGEAFALYVGIAQIPMYFAPLLLGPLAARLMPERPGETPG